MIPRIYLTVLMGTKDPCSSFSALSGCKGVLQIILVFVEAAYRGHMKKRIGALLMNSIPQFPKYKNRQCNMMPFVLGDKSSLPESLQAYWQLISVCPANDDEAGRVGYLTVDERKIQNEGETHRRAGLHTETPGCLQRRSARVASEEHRRIIWGDGYMVHKPVGGIYMASNVENSCSMFPNLEIERPEEVVGPLGSLEHIRFLIENGEPLRITLEANRIYWLTDRTPHESLPLRKGTKRQFFRLVTSAVSVWYADHSTANPLGIQPAAQIIHGSKFVDPK